ncbi:MAG TPA: zinc-dependent metalloprotease [Kofleriaceae bacterium]|nr:zinc-dependent metalloprotease [Kofleriaceae bacterium]
MKRTLASLWLSAAAALVSAGAGCATGDTPDDSLLAGDVLVSVPREVDAKIATARSATLASRGAAQSSSRGEDFYLAIRRSALESQWFLSMYLKELSPYGPNPGTLGTKVIRFREQNGKLFVFDADNRRATSDVFSPDLIIDAFPIVNNSGRFNSMPGSGGYILIDPAAGLNRFSALADLFAAGDPASAVRLETELSFVQKFKRFNDGASFEQIITTYAETPIGSDGDVEGNEFRLAATLGISLRQYSETPEFAPVAAPRATHYFLSEPYNIPNTGDVAQDPVHWGFHPGMEPVKWLISPVLAQIAADPALGGADLVAAAKAGIESWNAVLGYTALTAELATGDESFAEDRVNYLIVDPDLSKGYAYADWRTNPNTGEIRGASVYFGGGFFSPFEDDEEGGEQKMPAPKAKQRVRTLQWQGQHRDPLCVMWGRDYQTQVGPPANASLTGKQKLERYIQHVVAHEIGHTLGLRHNFKGSLRPPTSSIMEYNASAAAIAQPTPGEYDAQAIKYLYGQTTALPNLPFCTDEQTLTDPNCVRFDDPTPTPLTDYQIPTYSLFSGLMLDGFFSPSVAPLIVQFFGTEVLAYARRGTAAEAAAAWTAMLDGARAPLSAEALAANPALGAAANALSAAVYDELYLNITGAISNFPNNAAVASAMATDAKNILLNGDRVRTFATRRLIVDALKKAQNSFAFLALNEARSAIAGTLPGLTPTERALTEELLSRIDRAITPYFQ